MYYVHLFFRGGKINKESIGIHGKINCSNAIKCIGELLDENGGFLNNYFGAVIDGQKRICTTRHGITKVMFLRPFGSLEKVKVIRVLDTTVDDVVVLVSGIKMNYMKPYTGDLKKGSGLHLALTDRGELTTGVFNWHMEGDEVAMDATSHFGDCGSMYIDIETETILGIHHAGGGGSGLNYAYALKTIHVVDKPIEKCENEVVLNPPVENKEGKKGKTKGQNMKSAKDKRVKYQADKVASEVKRLTKALNDIDTRLRKGDYFEDDASLGLTNWADIEEVEYNTQHSLTGRAQALSDQLGKLTDLDDKHRSLVDMAERLYDMQSDPRANAKDIAEHLEKLRKKWKNFYETDYILAIKESRNKESVGFETVAISVSVIAGCTFMYAYIRMVRWILAQYIAKLENPDQRKYYLEKFKGLVSEEDVLIIMFEQTERGFKESLNQTSLKSLGGIGAKSSNELSNSLIDQQLPMMNNSISSITQNQELSTSLSLTKPQNIPSLHLDTTPTSRKRGKKRSGSPPIKCSTQGSTISESASQNSQKNGSTTTWKEKVLEKPKSKLLDGISKTVPPRQSQTGQK